jgi:hypothetical protein
MKTTLEEAAWKYGRLNASGRFVEPKKIAFEDGAKWQQEKMYSEDEVIELLQKYRYDLSSGKTANIGDTTKSWFEQNKKK